MKLYDFHAHTSGISRCSRMTPEMLCRVMKKDGVDGFVLTNHYAPYHVTVPFEEWLHKYEDEYLYTKKIGAEMGLQVFFGIEVTIDGKDFLIYGVESALLFESKGPLYDYTLKELLDFVHLHGGVLLHAHPFRGKSTPADPQLVDGYEINCHPLYGTTFAKEVHDLIDQVGGLITCGSDFHGDIYKAHCGVYLPDDLTTEKELALYLKKGQPQLLEHVIDPVKAKEPVNFE